MYELVNPEGYPYSMPRADNTVVVTLLIVVIAVAATVYFLKKDYSGKEKEDKGYHYILERDKEGRITSILERQIKG